MTAPDRPGISEWRDAAFDDYRDAVEIAAMLRAPGDVEVRKRVLRIRSRTEPLLIRAGMLADGDRL